MQSKIILVILAMFALVVFVKAAPDSDETTSAEETQPAAKPEKNSGSTYVFEKKFTFPHHVNYKVDFSSNSDSSTAEVKSSADTKMNVKKVEVRTDSSATSKPYVKKFEFNYQPILFKPFKKTFDFNFQWPKFKIWCWDFEKRGLFDIRFNYKRC